MSGLLASIRRNPSAWLLLAVTIASLGWSLQDWWDPRADAAHYILVAQSVMRGEGFAVNGHPYTIRPPGMSLLLMPALATAGVEFGVINLWVSLFGIAAALLLWLEFRDRAGPWMAFGVGLFVWFNPEVQRLCNGAMSDVPGTAMALAALATNRWAKRGGSLARPMVLGLTVAAAMYLRASNLALLPALALDRLWAPDRPLARRRALADLAITLVVVAAVYGPWVGYAATHPTPGDRRVHSYETAFLNADSTDPDSPRADASVLRTRLGANVSVYAALLGSALERTEPRPLDWVISAGVLSALGVALLTRRSASEWYAWISLAILAVYFTKAPRLVLPVFVLGVGTVAVVLRDLGSRFGGRRAGIALAAAGLSAWLGPHLRYDFSRSGGQDEWNDLQQAMGYVRGVASSTDRVGGDLGAAYAVLLGRPVDELRFLRNTDTPVDPVRQIEKKQLRLVVIRGKRAAGRLSRLAADLGKDVRNFGSYTVIRW